MAVSYSSYIRSREWAQFRQEYYRENRKRFGRLKCEECGITDFGGPPELHHLSYSNLGAESLESGVDVILLCPRCHDEKHPDHPDRIPITFQSLAEAIAAM